MGTISLSSSKKNKTDLLFYATLIICILLTLFVFGYLKKQAEAKQELRIESLITQVHLAMTERMADYIDAHYAGVGLFKSSVSVEREEWRVFVKEMNLIQRYPGINGLGYAVQVEHADKEEFIERVSKDGIADYSIRPVGIRENYFAIKYIEPIATNLPALGFDMGSEVNRRHAMESARDTGKPTLSKKIILVQDSGKTPGFLSYVPFYSTDEIPETIEERRVNFRGLIYAPFITRDFVEGVLNTELIELKNRLGLEIYDGNEIKEESLIFKSKDLESISKRKLFERRVSIDFYGREWIMKIYVEPDFGEVLNGASAQYFALLIGLVLTLLLLYVVRSVTNVRDRAVKIAKTMTVELNQKNIELEKINEDLQAFAHIASHDLKEPLRTVSSYAGVLGSKLKKSGESEDPDIEKYLGYIGNGCQRMKSLIEDLLDYSKFSKSEKVSVETCSQKILEDTLKLLETQIQEKNVQIKILNELPSLKIRETELSRLFQNLISNSIKYSTEEPYIEISSEALNEDGIYWFKVKDNGIGIAKEYQSQVFQLFQRLHKTEEYSGTGLGLSICKKIVEAHGGEISVESELNKGSSFIFTIKS